VDDCLSVDRHKERGTGGGRKRKVMVLSAGGSLLLFEEQGVNLPRGRAHKLGAGQVFRRSG